MEKYKFEVLSDVLKWLDTDEENLKLKVNEFLSKDCLDEPRISSTHKAMELVENHFKKSDKISVQTLELYEYILNAKTKIEVIAFLHSFLNETLEEYFFEMPTITISQMIGRPCRARDLEKFQFNGPSRTFNKTPCLLLCNNDETLLFHKNIVHRIEVGGNFVVPIPSLSTIEQLAIICEKNGKCSLVSATKKNLIVIANFNLEVPEKEEISWIDVHEYKNKKILFWGGTDHLRGQTSWNFHSGIDPENDDIFYEIDAEGEMITKELFENGLENAEFTEFGNLLTLWTHHEETEVEGKRKWKKNQSIIQLDQNCADIDSGDCFNVWGNANSFVTLHNGNDDYFAKIWTGGKIINSFKIMPCQNACVLFAHSR